MRRHGNLWDKVVSEDNIRLAYERAKKGKSSFKSIKKFEINEEQNLANIRTSLLNKTFRTSRYSTKKVYEPKERTIYVLPFYPDRIVQHALMNVLAPIFEGLFIKDSYACRKGKGQHAGSSRAMQFVKRNEYCLKCDIRKFYPSVDHEVLMSILRRKIKCPDTLWLIEEIVFSFEGGKNVPIGNYTSQWFGNLYLNELDTLVKQRLKIRDYLRYCDDFCLFHNDKSVLRKAALEIENFVRDKLCMELSKCDLFRVSRGVDFLGYRHFNGYILLRKSTAKRVKKRVSKLLEHLENGEKTPRSVVSSINSTLGWIKWANTYNLKSSLRLDSMLELVQSIQSLEETTYAKSA